MRKNPIYQHVHIGRPLNECNSIAAFFRSVRCFVQLREILPNVTDVFVRPSGAVKVGLTTLPSLSVTDGPEVCVQV